MAINIVAIIAEKNRIDRERREREERERKKREQEKRGVKNEYKRIC